VFATEQRFQTADILLCDILVEIEIQRAGDCRLAALYFDLNGVFGYRKWELGDYILDGDFALMGNIKRPHKIIQRVEK
jgi:hypothetical protein